MVNISFNYFSYIFIYQILYIISSILIDITNAICFCHENGIIHLDIKPQNVLIAFLNENQHQKTSKFLKKYICKICDFGCSIKLEEGINKELGSGTIRYMSPEVLQGIEISTSADVYSIGITMWHIKNNEIPYSSINSNDIVAYKVVKNDLRPDHLMSSSLKVPGLKDGHNCFCEQFSGDLLNNVPVIKITSPVSICSDSKSYFKERKYNLPMSNLIRSASPRKDKKKLPKKISKELIFSENLSNKLIFDHSPLKQMSSSPVKDKIIFLEQIFEEQSFIKKINIPKIERNYEQIYRKCWIKQATMRPTSDELLTSLKELLN